MTIHGVNPVGRRTSAFKHKTLRMSIDVRTCATSEDDEIIGEKPSKSVLSLARSVLTGNRPLVEIKQPRLAQLNVQYKVLETSIN